MRSNNEINFNLITLSFLDSALEAEFREDYFKDRLPQLRLDLAFGVFLYALFGIHDLWVIPDIKEFAWIIRYFIVCPFMTGVFIFTYSRHCRKALELSSFAAGFAAGAGVVLMIIRAAPPGNYMSYAGLLLCLLFYFRLRFVTSSLLTWSIFILYEAAALWDATIPARVLFSNTFIFSMFSLTGMFMSYTLEKNIRSGFLLRRTIQERNDKIEETNRELEREIIERMFAETALNEQMKFLRTMLDTIPNPVFYTDSQGRYSGCNKAYEIFFNQTREEIAGKSVCDVCLSDLINIANEVGMNKPGEHGVRTHEALLRHADGTTRKVLFSSATYADLDGNVAGMVGVVLDITDLKKAEDEKHRLETQLFQSQKMETVGQLAGGIAHEFNNILTAIIGYANLTRKNMPVDDPLYFYVGNIISSGERAARLTRDLLAFGRKQRIEPELLNLNEMLEKTESLLKMMIGEEIELTISTCDQPVCVMADNGLLRQVLLNLAANARDAMSKGGHLFLNSGLVKMDREFLHAHGTGEPGMYGVITVSDAGIGMDPKTMERIFEPFFTTKEVGKGTGLGLSMVYGIINQHHGYIDVDSEFGRGTTFRIYLPIFIHDELPCEPVESSQPATPGTAFLPADVIEICETAEPDPYPSGTEIVLVAEDNYTVRMLTMSLLQDNGYTVLEADNGEDAIRSFMEHANEIQLLILDVIMPKKTGWEVYDAIRKIRPDIRVIFMSGHTADAFRQRSIPEDRMNLLEKPILPGNLLRAVRKELDRKLPFKFP
jgi:PAS domain S-box-containing protein